MKIDGRYDKITQSMEPLSAITPDWSSRLRMSFYALLIACFSLYVQVDWSPELGDEGFLWYGALKTFQGQVPLRDFQSYFPGRYYFTAAFFNFLGPDLLAVRIAAWIFQVLALILAFRSSRIDVVDAVSGFFE